MARVARASTRPAVALRRHLTAHSYNIGEAPAQPNGAGVPKEL